MNLVICLLSTRQYLPAEKIRDIVAGYDDSATFEAFSRMFERDKNEIRDLGIPLETGIAARFGGVEGYRINRDEYELPEVDLNRAEAAAVAIAVRLWESPELSSAAQTALLKLRAAGVQVESEDSAASVTAVPARSRGSEPTLGALIGAVDAGQSVRFSHRASANDAYTSRTVEPWGVVTHRGRWYLVGHDVDRNDTRTFRLSRIADDVQVFGSRGEVRKPEGVDLQQIVERITDNATVSGTARVWVAEGRALELRRLGREVRRERIGRRDGSVLELPFPSWEWAARLIAGFGPDAMVVSPADLRSDVIGILTMARGVS